MTEGATRTVLMHVGQGKTGSSFLQSCLALSVEELDRLGIAYPIAGAAADKGRAGHVSMGNFPPTSRETGHDPEAYRQLLDQADPARHHAVLISNEALCGAIAQRGLLPRLLERSGGFRLRLLVFVRDPLDHAISAWQQDLKGGQADDLGDFLAAYSIPLQVRNFLLAARVAGVEVTLRNYSRCSGTLVPVFESWMGVPAGTLKAAPRESVNRSLTRAEMAVQRAFNAHVGKWARLFVADALSNELPHIVPEKPYIDAEVLRSFLARMAVQLGKVNPLLPEAEQLRLPSLEEAMADLPSPEAAARLSLSAEQIDVLARHMAPLFRPRYLSLEPRPRKAAPQAEPNVAEDAPPAAE